MTDTKMEFNLALTDNAQVFSWILRFKDPFSILEGYSLADLGNLFHVLGCAVLTDLRFLE